MAQLRIVKGMAVSGGLALGRVHIVRATPRVVPTWSIPSNEVEKEIERLARAIALTGQELQRRKDLVAAQSGPKDAEILSLHRMLLEDPAARKRVEARIRDQRINAEAAVGELIERFRTGFGALGGGGRHGYAADFSDPWRAVLDALLSREREQVVAAGEQVVLAAAELTPQVVTFLERERVLAVITETGGRFSHGAVLARSFGVPCVVGLANLLSRLEQGMRVGVDGDRGTVQLKPGEADVDLFLERLSRRKARESQLSIHAALPCVTPDGHRFGVQVNIEALQDLDTFPIAHSDGVGLLRTEFLYMERSQFPSEEEQYRLYRRVVERMEGRPVTLRTLDIGNDKRLPYFKTPEEANPALGWRGLRISLEWQDLLRVQLRAALRASAHGELRVLLPMVCSIEEVRQVRHVYEEVRAHLVEQGYEVAPRVPLGIMVEVPSTVLVLPDLLPLVDFVSVGTNDLVQYLLAADRDNPWVAKLYDPQHPAVWWSLRRVAEAARQAGKPSSVCGEMAGDYATAVLLMGMGYDAVSVVPHLLPQVKFAVREMPMTEAAQLAQSVVHESTAEGIGRVLARARERLHRRHLAENDAEGALESTDSAREADRG